MTQRLVVLTLGLALTGCNLMDGSPSSQQSVCLFKSLSGASACSPGQVILYEPTRASAVPMGRVAAQVCDFRHAIQVEDERLTCIMHAVRDLPTAESRSSQGEPATVPSSVLPRKTME